MLRKALAIAERKGDTEAAARIQKELGLIEMQEALRNRPVD